MDGGKVCEADKMKKLLLIFFLLAAPSLGFAANKDWDGRIHTEGLRPLNRMPEPTPSPKTMIVCADGNNGIVYLFPNKMLGYTSCSEWRCTNGIHDWKGGDWYVVGGTRTMGYADQRDERIVRPVEVCQHCGILRIKPGKE